MLRLKNDKSHMETSIATSWELLMKFDTMPQKKPYAAFDVYKMKTALISVSFQLETIVIWFYSKAHLLLLLVTLIYHHVTV